MYSGTGSNIFSASVAETVAIGVLSPEAFATAAGAAQAETGNAVMAAAEAAGCNVSALMGGSSAESGGAEEISPAEAWRAMAALEEQLARETDFSEDASVRQASTLLRQMLTKNPQLPNADMGD
ncbi:hypothetical protein AK812_SmicGene10932 [Symbiodinium microadriaticum]|uniref:Uncharacterized protein n=1 Tax=Symbiodinium microadriaticum TaxID=2951 RepID=A0A1Q9EEK0_SYMMI|nr:hypothetical protein AK812_SmicGene10932 [Symbiodinium microadriaticum]